MNKIIINFTMLLLLVCASHLYSATGTMGAESKCDIRVQNASDDTLRIMFSYANKKPGHKYIATKTLKPNMAGNMTSKIITVPVNREPIIMKVEMKHLDEKYVLVRHIKVTPMGDMIEFIFDENHDIALKDRNSARIENVMERHAAKTAETMTAE